MCDISQFAELDKVAGAPADNYHRCLRSLADHPSASQSLKSQFQKLGDDEVYALSCSMYIDDSDFDRYIFLDKDGFKVLNLPIYNVPYGDDVMALPDGVIHFKQGVENFYMLIGIDAQPTIYPESKLSDLAAIQNKTVRTLKSTMVAPYELRLARANKSSAINIASAKEEDSEHISVCLNKRVEESAHNFLGKYSSSFLSNNGMVDDYNAHQNLSEVRKKLYQSSWAEKKSAVIKDFSEAHPSCLEIFDLNKLFDERWGDTKERYEQIRQRFYSN